MTTLRRTVLGRIGLARIAVTKWIAKHLPGICQIFGICFMASCLREGWRPHVVWFVAFMLYSIARSHEEGR